MAESSSIDLVNLWRIVLGEIELSVSKANFTIWFKNTSVTRREDDTIVVSAPNIFTREWLENKYHTVILEALQRIEPTIMKVRYEISSSRPAAVRPIPGSNIVITKRATMADVVPPQNATVEQPRQETGTWDANSNLNARYTFDSFVVGANNELAYAAAQAVARRPGAAYNPLFIYGGVGLGKTHLLQAIGNMVAARGTLRVRYVAIEKFMHELITAIQTKVTHTFKERYRGVDVLIVDDIQSIVGKEKTQDEFFHTFNELHGAGKQVVISSDRPPKAIPTLEERLRSRFEGGMIADIGAPDLETRIAILKAKCALRETAVPEEALTYIATQVTSNIRELEGMLNRVIGHCEFRGGTLTLEITKEVLASLLARPKRRIIHTDRVIEIVSSYYNLRPNELIGESRRKEVVLPRQIAMYLLRSENGQSFPTIGQSFGGKDHTTVMHACEKIGGNLETDEVLRQDLTTIKQKLYVTAEL